MDLSEAVRSGFDHFSNWKGRASRSAYWYLFLAYVIAYAVPFIIGSLIGGAIGTLFMIIAVIAALAFLVPLISVAVRRLHDTGRSGWWWFISFIPLIGSIWLLVLMVLESEPGENQYGPNPAGGVSEPGSIGSAPATEQVPPAAS